MERLIAMVRIPGMFLRIVFAATAVPWPMQALATPVPAAYDARIAAVLMLAEAPKPSGVQHPAVASAVRLAARGQLAAACQDSDRRFRALQAEGSKLFFGPDRRKAELSAIERYLDRNVRSKAPALEIVDEGFAPGPAWRAVVAAACVQSGQPAVAVRMLAAMASHAPRSVPAARFAVALASQERDWAKGLASAPDNTTLPALLLRALVRPGDVDGLLGQAAHAAATDRDRAAVSAVRNHLGRAP